MHSDAADNNRERTGHRSAGAGRTSATVRVVLTLALFAAAGAAAYALPGRQPAQRAELPAYVSIEREGLRYEFDALQARAAVFELLPDGTRGREVTDERADAARRLRAALEAELGVDSLDRLVDQHRDSADSLRRLGYL